jgi:hypothetical protein
MIIFQKIYLCSFFERMKKVFRKNIIEEKEVEKDELPLITEYPMIDKIIYDINKRIIVYLSIN